MTPVTPNRNTTVTFDDFLPSPAQPAVLFSRSAFEMGAQPSTITNVHFVPEIGWQLKGFHWDAGELQESTDGFNAILTEANGKVQHAPGVFEFDSFRKTTELTGVSFAGSVPTSGGTVYQKRVASGESWADAVLSADQAGFPSPLPGEDPVTMDRIVRGTANHKPTDQIVVTFYAPASGFAANKTLLTFFFTGPAGSTADWWGNGQYGLKVYGNGMAKLLERGNTTNPIESGVSGWFPRFEFQWSEGDSRSVLNGVHRILIASDTVESGGTYTGSKILFFSSTVARPGFKLLELLRTAAISAVKAQAGIIPIYNVPNLKNATVQEAPIRIDSRRDLRPIYQVAEQKFPASGLLLDAPFSLETVMRPTSETDKITFEYFCNRPTGTTLTGRLCYADGTELAGRVVTISNENGVQVTYPVPEGNTARHFRAKFEFTSTGNATPTLKWINVFRIGAFETPDITIYETPSRESGAALWKSMPTSININGQSREPSESRASITIADLADEYPALRTRRKIPIHIETEVDDEGTKATLFRGYVISAPGTKKFPDRGRAYPAPTGRVYDVSCAGEWTRLQETLAPRRFVWTEETGPYKVTRIIRVLLSLAYPPEMIDIPELDIRLLGSDPDSFMLEPGSPITDVITGLASSYLGGWIYFDESAGTLGMWRLGLPENAGTILARFEMNPPTDRLGAFQGSYGNVSIDGQDQPVVRTFIRKRTYSEDVEAPEGNVVEFYGASFGENGASLGAGDGAAPSVVLYNLNSYNFWGLPSSSEFYPDGSHPDFIGRPVPIRVYDYKAGSLDACLWIARRVFDAACHAKQTLEFEAPLIFVTDEADVLQTRPRPPRFYDSVQAWSEDANDYHRYLVVRCDPSYRKDGVQMARYQLVRPSNLDTLISVPNVRGGIRNMLERVANQQAGQAAPQLTVVGGSVAKTQQSRWAGMPDTETLAAQVLDPDDADFGKFYFVPGLSRAGGPDVVRP